MNAKIAIVLFACLCYSHGCNRHHNNNCSGSASCNHHVSKRSIGGNNASGQETINIQLRKSQYLVQVQGDPCSFATYDKNSDGVISLGELVDIFGIDIITRGVFKDIDVMTGDATITPEEFDANVSHIIPVCKHTAE